MIQPLNVPKERWMIEELAMLIFTGVTCQMDVDARVGDFVSHCRTRGFAAVHGKVEYWPINTPPVRITGWSFRPLSPAERSSLGATSR